MELSERIAAVAASSRRSADPFAEVKDRIHRRVIAELGPQLSNDELDAAGLRERVRRGRARQLEQESGLSRADRERLVDAITDETLGHGPLEKLLADDTVTEIMVNGPVRRLDRARRPALRDRRAVRRRGAPAADHQQDRRPVGRRIDEASPMVDARLPDGSRVNAIIPPLSLERAAASRSASSARNRLDARRPGAARAR